MKKNTYIKRFLLILGLALLALTTSFLFNHTTSKASDEPFQVQETDKNKHSLRQASLECLTHKLENHLIENGTTPIHIQDLEADIDSWFQNKAQKPLPQTDHLLLNDIEFIHNIDLHTVPFSDTIVNFILSKDSYATDLKKSTYHQTLTFDFETETVLHFDDFIQTDQQNFETFKTLVENEMPQEVVINKKGLEQSIRNTQELKWSITQESLTLYWDAFEISDNALQVSIPLEYLDKLAVTERLEAYMPEKQAAVVEVLSKKTLDPNGKYIALTFDDGPDPDITPRVLDILQNHNVVATFYLLGSRVPYAPELVEQMVKNGHELGNHTFDHIDVSKAAYASISEEIRKTNEHIFEAGGVYPKTLRTPFGAMSPAAEAVAENYTLPIIMWSADSRDWESRNPSAILETVMFKSAPGGIVLLHDVHETTADALPSIISSLRNQGYEFVTVTEILSWLDATGVGPHFGQKIE